MKCAKTLTLMVLAMASTAWSVEPSVDIGKEIAWKDRHRAEIDETDLLTLAKDGVARAQIVVPGEPLPLVRLAAEELKAFLDRATGADFKIVSEREDGMAALLLGNREQARLVAAINVDALPLDAFRIRRVGDAVFIAGSSQTGGYSEERMGGRATLYGVYHFLERFVGVRFYFPGEIGTVVPKKATLQIPRMDVLEAPDFWARRHSSIHRGPWFATQQRGEGSKKASLSAVGRSPRRTPFGTMDRAEWFEKVCTPQRWRSRTLNLLIPATHSLARSELIERFGESRPDFFALLRSGKRDNDAGQPGHRGHLCYSNPDLADEIYKDGVAYLTGKPPKARGLRNWSGASFWPGFFNVMPPDGWQACQCPKCKPFNDEGRQEDLVWGFIDQIARRLGESGISGHVTAMSYSVYGDVPTVDIPDNVLVVLAAYGPWGERIPGYTEKTLDRVRAWREKLGGRQLIWHWTYARPIYFPLVPAVSPRCIASYYRKVFPHFHGIYMESEPNYWLFLYLNWYVFHKVAWDVATDVEELLAEHHRLMFGPAAAPMTRFYDRLEEKWMTEGLGKIRETPEGPVSVTPSDERMWTSVYGEEFLSELRGYLDEADKLAASAPDCTKRIVFVRRYILGTVIEARDRYLAKKRDIEDVVLNIPRLAQGAEIAVDGRLDEPAWRTAAVGHMVTQSPFDDDPLVKTAVHALWTAKHLLLGFDCEEPEVQRMLLANRKPDDPRVWKDASVEVYITRSAERTTPYPMFQWIMNANGNLSDNRRTTRRQLSWEWDSGADGAAQIDGAGWTAELRIPLAALERPGEPGAVFVANFFRSRNIANAPKKENQFYSWSPYLPIGRGFHHPDRFGAIRFVMEKPGDISVVKNGSFEAVDDKGVPEDWHFPRRGPSVGSVSVVHNTHRHGGKCLRIEGRADGQNSTSQYLTQLQPNTKYLLTFFVRTEDVQQQAASASGAAVDIYGAYGIRWYYPTPRLKGTTPWTRMTYELTTPAKLDRRPWMRLTLRKATGMVWYDDVRLRPVDKLDQE